MLVYGEAAGETKKLHRQREYRIGHDKMYKKETYDHVGVKSCINGGFSTRALEKGKKGRRAFYSVLGLGIKKCGLNMSTCNLIFWSLIVPITLFSSDL